MSTEKSPVWQGKEPLHCVARRQETSDCTTFFLTTDPPMRFEFLPGQFILLGLMIDCCQQARAYSLAQQHANFHLHLLLSRDPLHPTRLDQSFLQALVPGTADAQAYICGSQVYPYSFWV